MLPDWIKKPNWMKNSSPPNGLQMSTLLLFSTIVLPLMLVGADMVTDVGVLGQMWPYTLWAKTLARRDSGNQAELNSTAAANSSSSDEAAVNEERNWAGVTNSTAEEQAEAQKPRTFRTAAFYAQKLSVRCA